jgi:tetratricopeptide (TPR) repeat protein
MSGEGTLTARKNVSTSARSHPLLHLFSAFLAATPCAIAQTSANPTVCAPLTGVAGLNDYRLRNSTPFLQWSIEDNKRNHMDIELERMRQGEYSRRVMGGLDFTLIRWPNHLPALQALIDYDLHGGKQYEFLPVECYFSRARQFVPDDPSVLLAQGYWQWRKDNRAIALGLYKEALAIDPKSAEPHYHIGLLYLELGDLDKANEHAQVAYRAGYPLPGLRNKLRERGAWNATGAAEDSTTSP